VCIRFPIKDVPSLIWTLNEKDVDYQDLSRDQLVNHFEGITNCLTTKRGYCELLKDLHLHSVDCNDIAPRCYNLGDPIHRDEFIDEFRLVACLNILKWYVLHSLEQQQLSGQQQQEQQQDHNINNNNNNNNIKLNNNNNSNSKLHNNNSMRDQLRITDDQSPPPNNTRTKYCMVSPPHDTNSSCCTCCLHPTAVQSSNSSICNTSTSMMRIVLVARRVSLWYLRVRLYGEWPGVDGSEVFRDQDTAPLDEKSWCEVLDASYDVVEASYQYRLEDVWELMMRCRSSAYAFNPLLTQLQAILWRYHQLTPQFACVDGFRNIWVVKAPDSSCGIGIKVLYRLDDILQSERGMGSRTVQKYVEYPLLAPLYVHTSGSTNNNSSTTTTSTASTSTTAVASSSGGGSGSSNNSNCNPSRSHNKILTKFDMRVWVLVTCFKSFRCFVYSTLYGRRCSSAYTSDVSSLGETFTHLTNYSIQKKQSFEVHQTIDTNATASSSSSSDSKTCIVNRDGDVIASSSTSSSARKLRQACSTSRPNSNSSSTHSNSSSFRSSSSSSSSSSSCHKVTYELSESDLLIDHDDIIRIVHSAYQQYLQQLSSSSSSSSSSSVDSSLYGAGTRSLSDKQLLAREVVRRIGVVEDVWRDYVWPAIKRKIAITLRGAREKVVHRPQCFEFLGYDVLIDEMLEPWILEVNMSPAMAHRTPNQCQLISHMSKGLVSLAISPWIHRNRCSPTTVEPSCEACHDNDSSSSSSSSDSSVGGAWEQLIYQLDPPYPYPYPNSDSHHPPTTTVEQSITDDWADCIPASPPSSEGLLHHQDCSDSITTTSESSREHPVSRHMNNLDNNSNSSSSRHHSSSSSGSGSGSGYFSKFSAIASLRKGSRAVTVDASTALIIIGSSISWSTIACFDYCCVGLDKIRRLQRCITYHMS
jgi:hypothetical protein